MGKMKKNIEKEIIELRGKKVSIENIENVVLKRVLESMLNNKVEHSEYLELARTKHKDIHSDVFDYTEQYSVKDKKSGEKIKIEIYREHI